MDTDLKPGYTTTEFWGTMAVHLLDAIGTVFALQHKGFDKSILLPLVPLFAFLASAVAQAVYTHSRSRLKAATSTNLAVVAAGAPPAPIPPIANAA